MQSKIKLVEKSLNEAQSTLLDLEQSTGHNVTYFAQQWDRQVEVQLDTISESAREKRERMIVLLDLEEQLLEARSVKSHYE